MSRMFSSGGNAMSALAGIAPALIAQHKQQQAAPPAPSVPSVPAQADTNVIAAVRKATLARRGLSTIMTDAAGDGQKLGG